MRRSRPWRAHGNIFEQLINTVKMNSFGQILAAL